MTKQNCRIAALQMVSGPRVGDNLALAARLVADAVDQGAQLVALPEYFPIIGAADADRVRAREDFGSGPVQDWLAATAQRHGIWVFAGSLPLTAEMPDKMRNASLAYNPAGECVARYDKMHLFRFDNGAERYDEARVLQAGALPQLFELPSVDGHVWRVGLSVCYDLRFPELYRHYTAQGADLLLVPSAFTHGTGQAHWELLLRARAVENLACVAAAAQGGLHENGRRTWGHTMVVDPWGAILARREADGEGVVLADLDARQLARCRAQLPALEHRRL